MALRPPEETYVRTDAELTALWRDMMGAGGFAQRSLWHVFFHPDGQLNPVVIPIDDIPEEPDEPLLRNLAEMMRSATEGFEINSIAVLLSRPGPQRMMASDRHWARALRAAYGPRLCPWPIHLATYERVQVFRPDDLVAA